MARRPDPFGPSASAAVFYACFFWVCVSWMMKLAPDWMLSYFMRVDEISVPFAHGLFLLSLIVATLAGHVLTAVQLQRNRTRSAVFVLCSGALLWFGLWGLSLRRYLAYGTTDDWLAGTTEPIATSEVADAMNMVGAITSLTLAGLVVFIINRNRRLRSL